ncbi:hypothetical protein ONZ45_g2917 [Pleurotus djamor]|nr:hypothetical protein ONZ45_g2917 [Pleurotus djamor]
MVNSIMEHSECFEEVAMNAASMSPDHLLFATHICKKLFTDTYLLPKLKSFHIYANIAIPGPFILLRKALHPLPSLRSLRLHGAVIPLEHPFEAPQLEYLDISLPLPPHEPPTSWLIRLFKGFPVLRTLIVDRLHPRHALELAPKSISIPHLKHLEVSSSTTFLAQKFLDAFDMSLSVVNITLKITVSVMDASDFSRFEDLCIQYFHTSHRSTRCLGLNFATSRDSLGRPSSTFNLAVSTDADAPNFLNFILPWTPGTEDRYIRLTQRLSNQLTTNIHIAGAGSEQLSSLLPTLFPHFPSVTSLTIANCMEKILSTLLVPAITTATHPDPPLILPQLKKLSFTKCRLSEPEGAPTPLYSSLFEIVKDRHSRGDPIQDVVITQCDIAMNQVEELGTLVRVSWDG